jgi:hypothetical protein
MNKYLVTIRVKGQSMQTMVYADSSFHAKLILEYQFGMGNVMGTPAVSTAKESYTPLEEIIASIKPVKLFNPQAARIDFLKKQKAAVSKNLDAERDRQKISRAQQQIHVATTKKIAA